MTEIPAYDPSNIFAKVIRGEIPAIKVFEDDATLAIMDIFPQSDGHVLVIHKKAQAAMIFDLPEDALKSLIASVRKVARAVDLALKPAGIRIAQFNGAEAGQTIFHAHFHVVPVYAGRALRPHGGKPADSERLQETAGRIQAAL